MNYETEILREIWATRGNEEPIEVGPDRDGLKLVEIRWRDTDRQIIKRACFAPEEARLVAQAMLACANEIAPDEN